MYRVVNYNFLRSKLTNDFQKTNKSVEVARYRQESWEQYITQFEYEYFTNESLKRQFELLQTLGISALSEEDLTNVRRLSRSLLE